MLGRCFVILFVLPLTLTNKLSNGTLIFEINSLFLTEFFICYFGKNGPNVGPINLEKVICSTGFYSPPGIEIEAYTYYQLSMKSIAAENRRFGDSKWPKKTKILPYFGKFDSRVLIDSPAARWPV